MKDISEAKKYDRSYMEQSVKPVLEIGLKRTGEGLKIAYGTLYGWVQAAKNGDPDIDERRTVSIPTQRKQRSPRERRSTRSTLWICCGS